MTAFFITATGTDIGKTFVATELIRHFRRAGRAIDAFKPVVAGFDPAQVETSDPGRLLSALGKPIVADEIARISPFRFAAALAPDLAARRENRTLDFAALVAFSQRAIQNHSGTLLIEGVGGIMAPLDERHTVLDWMTALQLPLVLVAGSYLGSISHTLTCLDVLQRRALAIRALVVSETAGSTVPLADTVATVAGFAPSLPIVGLRRLPAQSESGVIDRISLLL
jgi:dethiobiotin synthetase